MINPKHMQDGDKHFFIASIAAPIIFWWVFVGRKRYSAKGMK